jgi:hypothetical protein
MGCNADMRKVVQLAAYAMKMGFQLSNVRLVTAFALVANLRLAYISKKLLADYG